MLKPNLSPLYQQVYQTILEDITSGKWQVNDKLPTDYEYADKLKVSPGTIRKAFDKLVANRIVKRMQGKGTFLNKLKAETNLFIFFRFFDKKGQSITPASKVLRQSIEPLDTSISKLLDIKPGSQALTITRIRYNKEVPFIYENVYLPLQYFKGLNNLKQGFVLPNTLYDYLQRDFDVHVHDTAEVITAVKSSQKIAKYLSCLTNTPLIKVKRIALDISKRKVEFRESYANSELVDYHHSIG